MKISTKITSIHVLVGTQTHMISKTLLVRFFFLLLLFMASSPVFAWTVDSLRKAAEGGSMEASAQLSTAYRLGVGTARDPQSAYVWAQKAAVSGLGYALYCQAECLREGLGTPPSPAAANELYKKAVPLMRAELPTQNAEHSYALSMCFANGLALPIREDSAAWYLRKAAESHFAPAEHLYYRIPLYQAQNERDTLEALSFLRSAADQLYEPAMTELAAQLAQRPSTEDLAYLYARRAAAMGSATGAYQCGAFSYAGVGVKRDTLQSEKWFLQAAAAGFPKAHAELGYRYAHAIGMSLDAQKARRFYLQALALQTDDRPGFSSFIHSQLDSLPCSEAEMQQSLQELASSIREILGRSGRPATYTRSALCSHTRRVWKRLNAFAQDTSAEQEFLACARNGRMRRVQMLGDSLMSRYDGTWSLSDDTQQLELNADSLRVLMKLEVMSPGMLVVREDSRLVLYERVSNSQLQRIPSFKGTNTFGEMQLVFRKADITDQGAVRLRLQARNVPADGATLSIDSVHIVGSSFGLNDRKQSFNFSGPDFVYEDGELTLVLDLRSELRSTLTEGHCQLEVSAVYAIDEAHRQFTMRTGDINLPRQMKE